ncbi:Ger(x)C family spore germination protein [Paenibacillus sp. YN15]|uniref:Ger(x)C family spore germination protein n=1 Tax=Paenibacillus sp. YN15 TaxID=1742774 RepID=UPI000DCE1BA5|nr:Ger(x)C family spore germination protein [Paenibacillus sp. YN15]RAU91419.1 Ger(x)C family spore germination protein [Paenibacillus sp. YN15]
MMKKWLIAILLAVSTAGCWDYTELSDIFFVVGMAVDKGTPPFKYKMTVECIVPSEYDKTTGGRTAPSQLYSMQGNTIADLSRKMNIGLGRELVYSHMQLLAISESIAREGDLQFFDYLERSRESRDTFNVVVVKGRQAEEVLKITNPTEKYATGKLSKQLQSAAKEWGSDPDVRLSDLLNARMSPGKGSVAAAVSVSGAPDGSKANMESSLPLSNSIITGLAVLRDMKLLGFMDVRDTRSYLWLRGGLRNTSVTASCAEGKDFTIRIVKSSTKVKASHEGQTPRFHVTIRVDSFLEMTECPNALTASALKEYAQHAEAAVAEDIRQTLKKAQVTHKTDIFGFGSQMYRQQPKFFKPIREDWNTYFARAEITVETHVRIRRVGLNTNSISE